MRPANLKDDRVTREMKMATDARKSLVKREIATVELWLLIPGLRFHVRGNNGGEREASAVDNVSGRRKEFE